MVCIKEQLDEKWEQLKGLTEGTAVVSKRELGLLFAVLLLAGVLIGILLSPVTKGVTVASNNRLGDGKSFEPAEEKAGEGNEEE